ncbi:non-ltr RNAse hi domain of reverse transcriptases [Plakobranchus ocellatus]|uniref:Non-ltr RNAse hi domain of reverse transcriptases n=1 Tax=Plakobranchus ocellatus TaxID=259542 RepID=A0AAV3XZN9_9GAST|nr:non-ltr RNAse hi domain of reverse transcriptases [Plakobranchus ocellatus]
MNKKMKEGWQNMWDRETKGTFFREIVPKVGPSKLKFTRRLEPLNRLRLGMTRYKHADRECGYCRKKVTTEHILFQCPGLTIPRNYLRNMCRQYQVSSPIPHFHPAFWTG